MGVIVVEFMLGLLMSMTLAYVGWNGNNKTLEMLGLAWTLFFLALNIITIASPTVSSALINSSYV